MEIRTLGAVAGIVLVAGCSSVEPERLNEVAAETAALRGQAAALQKKFDEKTKPVEWEKKHREQRRLSEEKLKKVKPLPEKPTDAEVLAYAKAVLETGEGRNSFSSGDAQVEALEKIGPGYLELLVPLLKHDSFYLSYALPKLAGPGDKEAVIRLLRREDSMLKVVLERGWVPDARRAILGKLKNGGNGLDWQLANSLEWVIPQIARTPQERREIVGLFVFHPGTAKLFEAICDFPESEVDLPEITRQAWRNHQFDRGDDPGWFALYAAWYGESGALVDLLEFLNDGGGRMNQAAEVLPGYAAALLRRSGSVPELLEYCRKNRGKLVFDSANRCYHVPGEKSEGAK